MTSATLHWEFSPDQVRFWLQRQGDPLPVDQWGIYDIETPRGRGSVGHLLAMVEDETAGVGSEQVVLSHAQVAQLDRVEIDRLGLPEPAPYRLELRGSGLLASPSFRFQHRLIGIDGRPVLGAKSTGAFVQAAKKRCTLLDPIYSLVTGVEAFNDTAPSDLDARFLRWSELKDLLPEDAVVDQHLRSMNIARADSFTLDFSDDGQVHPVLISHTGDGEADEESRKPGQETLTPDAQRSFAGRFNRLPRAQARYALDGGWYVVLGAPLRRALEVVREVQGRPAEERRAFLDNPVGVLKDRLGDDLDDSAIEVVFEETPAYLRPRARTRRVATKTLCLRVASQAGVVAAGRDHLRYPARRQDRPDVRKGRARGPGCRRKRDREWHTGG